MAYARLIAFDRRLAGANVRGASSDALSASELESRLAAAYRRGVDDTRALADQQMVESRADIAHVGEGVFKKLDSIEPLLVGQLRDALPGLALELARRLLAGYEPPPEVVSRLCEETLAELFPERSDLELVVSPRDAACLAELHPAWTARFPNLRITADASLHPGDCQVRSRFGLTDARQSTKLLALEHSLAPT